MIDSTNDLSFSDYNSGKVVGTHAYVSIGNGLLNKSATEIIIPERYLGVKVTEIGYCSFQGTKIPRVFLLTNVFLTLKNCVSGKSAHF